MFKHKKILIASIIAVVIVIGIVAINVQNASKQASKIQDNLALVTYGSITDKVKGTGVVSSNEKYDITPLVTGTVISSEFNEGDFVQQGDVLYIIDSKDLDMQIKTARINLTKSEEMYNQSVTSVKDLTTISSYSGKIQKLYVSKGDFVQSGTKILDIIDNNNLILKIPFNTSDIDKIKLGSPASITLASSSLNIQGNVSRIYDSTDTLDGYKRVTYIEITAKNPGAISKGEKAYAMVNGISCNSEGEFLNLIEKSIVSNGTGQIIELNVLEGDYIQNGKTVMRLKNDQLTNAVNNSKIAVSEAKNTLDNLTKQLEDYEIKSPISGKIVTKNTKKGDIAVPSTILMTVSDTNNLYVDVEVDEIYISKISIGHIAKISAEATPGRTFDGEVVRINDMGIAKNGVTYYPVKVKIQQTDELKMGMNLNVEIINMQKENTLLIPKAALDGDSVMLFENNKLTKVKVETGIKDDEYIEVIDVLKNGDKVSVNTDK